MVLVLAAVPLFEPAPPVASAEGTRKLGDFLIFVFTDVDQFWRDTFALAGLPFESPGLQGFDGPIMTACGPVPDAGEGPFYCPVDQVIYLDVPFLVAIWERDADFAVAYALAHEYGHHVQNEIGVRKTQNPKRPGEVYSWRLELMADCFAGVWGNSTAQRGLLEPGDIEEAIGLAWSIGDTARTPRTSLSAHGTGRERVVAFVGGLRSGDPSACSNN